MTTRPIPDKALNDIASILQPVDFSEHSDDTSNKQLYGACKIIADLLGLNLCAFSKRIETLSLNEALEDLGSRSNFHFRKVSLKDHGWQSKDSGTLLAFHKESGQACALVQIKSNRYSLLTPGVNGQKVKLEKIVDSIQDEAYMLYKDLPDNAVSLKKLLTFSFEKLWKDIGLAISLQLLISVFGLLAPIATGIMFDTVVPNADIPLLLEVTAILSVNVFVITLFKVSQAISFLRLRFKINVKVQAAVWSRVIKLPIALFRKFGSGDFAIRARAIDAIQNSLTGAVFSSIIGGLLSFVSLGLMLYYSLTLMLTVIALVFVAGVIYLIAALAQIHQLRREYYHRGKLATLSMQFILGINKLRLSNSEDQAMLLWSNRFAKASARAYKNGIIANNLITFNTVFVVVNTMCIFAVMLSLDPRMSFGSFIAFNAAASTFFTAIFNMEKSLIGILSIIPLYERAKPILETIPESSIANNFILDLKGKIDIRHVSFQYAKDKPMLFKDLTLTIRPGELVAIVGSSGAGKSSLLRLLLGFEKPKSGLILYDDSDLEKIYLPSLRKHLGVVLQDTSPLPGTIYENIVGIDARHSIEDAWQAVRLVELEEDIKKMPMGMHTIVTEGGQTFSCGQMQRLMLARALISKPNILLLDEATSALDTTTQARIHKNLSALNITRVMATHRLHMLKNVDTIYVLNNGEIVEYGSFAALREKQGLFSKMLCDS